MSQESTNTFKVPADRLLLRVITPIGLVFEQEVSSVTLPAIDGEIGVLPGHVGYSGLLGTGVLHFSPFADSNEAGVPGNRVVINGGFCSVQRNVLTILADQVDKPGSLDAKALSAIREAAEKALSDGSLTPEAREPHLSSLKRADALEDISRSSAH